MAVLAITPLHSEEGAHSPVGIRATLEQVVLPGTQLEARSLEGDLPLVVRVTGVWPHGTAHRYDIEYYGLEPGQYDLRNFLRRKDGTTTADLPSLDITISSLLGPENFQPAPLRDGAFADLGGYRRWLTMAGVGWVLGLLVFLATRKRRRSGVAITEHEPTMEERLRPLVEEALRGGISARERAELERILVSWWRDKLDLGSMAPAEVLLQLRHHEEAGRLLRKLDEWLHRPGGETVDIGELLAPYRGGA